VKNRGNGREQEGEEQSVVTAEAMTRGLAKELETNEQCCSRPGAKRLSLVGQSRGGGTREYHHNDKRGGRNKRGGRGGRGNNGGRRQKVPFYYFHCRDKDHYTNEFPNAIKKKVELDR